MKTPNFETDPIILNWVDRQVSSVREITNAVKDDKDFQRFYYLKEPVLSDKPSEFSICHNPWRGPSCRMNF